MKKISKVDLLRKLDLLDERLLNIWIQDNPSLSDEEKWDIFVILLESRVELLKACRDAGVKLSSAKIVPEWLERLSASRADIKRREIRQYREDTLQRKKLGVYESIASVKEKK